MLGPASARLLAMVLVVTVGSLAPVATASGSTVQRDSSFTRYDAASMGLGKHRGTVVTDAGIAFGTATGTREQAGRSYERARWTAPWQMSDFAYAELIASWAATTPGDSWLEVDVRGRNSKGVTSSWDLLGRWTSGEKFVRRTTESPQSDDLAAVDVDTWRVRGTGGLVSWQVRLSLFRKPGSTGPTVAGLGVMTSRLPRVSSVDVSTPGPDVGTELDVPAYSQMAHSGHYPQWGGGGEAWCSPTSTSMVLGYLDALPPPYAYRFVPAGHPAPWVDYAAPLAGDAFVTRLRSLREAETFVAAGIPLVASVSWGSGELSGAPVSASNGHLVVIVGFTV